MPFPHWLGKIHHGDYFMDVIFSSGNGVARVDDLWFEHAPRTNVLGLIVRLSPAEEMIWSKAFIQERERFDGADVLHLLRETGPSLDWPRLLMRFGDYWRVLLSHLILFGFVYPDKRQNMPAWVMDELLRRLAVSRPNLQNDVCYGTLLSREQYLHDLEQLKYRDGREEPEGPMSREQIEIWTAAIPGEGTARAGGPVTAGPAGQEARDGAEPSQREFRPSLSGWALPNQQPEAAPHDLGGDAEDDVRGERVHVALGRMFGRRPGQAEQRQSGFVGSGPDRRAEGGAAHLPRRRRDLPERAIQATHRRAEGEVHAVAPTFNSPRSRGVRLCGPPRSVRRSRWSSASAQLPASRGHRGVRRADVGPARVLRGFHHAR